MTEIIPVDQTDRRKIDEFIISRWYTLQMIVHDEIIDLGSADGFVCIDGDEIIGLITYRYKNSETEILSLDSTRENQGIGTALINAVTERSKSLGAVCIKVTTTNDDLNALHFYQKRGFDMYRLCRNAVDKARKIKPEIPLIGTDGIPLRHEIELIKSFEKE